MRAPSGPSRRPAVRGRCSPLSSWPACWFHPTSSPRPPATNGGADGASSTARTQAVRRSSTACPPSHTTPRGPWGSLTPSTSRARWPCTTPALDGPRSPRPTLIRFPTALTPWTGWPTTTCGPWGAVRAARTGPWSSTGMARPGRWSPVRTLPSRSAGWTPCRSLPRRMPGRWGRRRTSRGCPRRRSSSTGMAEPGPSSPARVPGGSTTCSACRPYRPPTPGPWEVLPIEPG